MASETTGWSEDGQWFWDGSQWNEAVSPDGQHIYDGTAWKPFTGSRSPLPSSPFASPSPPPPSPVEAASPVASPTLPPAEYPAWMDPAEVLRLKEEKASRRIRAKEAPARSQPINWDEVHETARTGGGSRLQKMSRFLLLMVLFWSLIIFLALYALFVYLPAHPLSHSR